MKNKQRIIRFLYILFLLYAALMIWEVFIGPYRSYGAVRRYNLYPFKTIMNFLMNREKHGFHAVFINLAANIITFMPLGFFIAMSVRKPRRHVRVLRCCFIIIIAVELGQLVLNVGVFDVDDIILNMIGCILGLLVYKKVKRISDNKESLF